MDIQKQLKRKARVGKNVVHRNMYYSFESTYTISNVEKICSIELIFEVKRTINYHFYCTVKVDGGKFKYFKCDDKFLNSINFSIVSKSVKEKKISDSKLNLKTIEIFETDLIK
tara:strand:+ start:22 stop:360 length:339 start_codon:yes stop_codon:yes gene_type:complete